MLWALKTSDDGCGFKLNVRPWRRSGVGGVEFAERGVQRERPTFPCPLTTLDQRPDTKKGATGKM